MSVKALQHYLQERSGPLLTLLAFLTLLIIPFRILLYNYTPQDDALRHVAKVVSGRAWPNVLVMNPDFAGFDHNQGWHAILSGLQQLGLDKEGLLDASVIGLFLIFVMTGLVLHRQAPESWMTAMVLGMMFCGSTRLLLGRPFILAASVLMILLQLWRLPQRRPLPRMLASTVLFALAAWVHGSWYLFALVPICLFCTGRFREAGCNAAAWLGGSVLAGILTGHPLVFLFNQIGQTLASVQSTTATRLLVSEFQPSFQFAGIAILLALLIWQKVRGQDFWTSHGQDPAFWLILIGWALAFKNGRFWSDWGGVALLTWTAGTLTPEFQRLAESQALRRLLLGGILASALYLSWTADAGSRWSNNEFTDPLNAADPAHAGWLPDPGGILYSDSMRFYYQAFYTNPDGPWRYILGHEPALMPADDLAILREIQFYRGDVDHLFKPWIDKFTPADRLVLTRSPKSRPEIPGLEWKYVSYQTWVGRLPRDGALPLPADSL